MAIGLKTRLDYDDYCAIPADGKRYELLDGQVHVAPAPSPLHQRVSKRLQRLLEAYFEAPGRGGKSSTLLSMSSSRPTMWSNPISWL